MITARRGVLRGGGFFMFLAVLLPITLIGVALIADYSRAVLAGRQMTNTADIVAMAAATAFNETGARTTTTLDPVLAKERAVAMLGQAVVSGMVPDQYDVELADVELSADLRTVSVTLTYTIPDFFVVGLFSDDESLRAVNGRVTRAASVCLPDDPERIAAAGCAYPLT